MRIFPENWMKAAVRTGIVVCLIVLVNAFCVKVFRTFGMSMEPTVPDGRAVVANRLFYRFHALNRGDLVVFRTSNRPYVYFLKRIIGLPGETVEFRNGKLFVNGTPVAEPYLSASGIWNVPSFKVKEGHVFVVGDNRSVNWEEHFHPEISPRTIVGKVIGYP